MGFSSSKTKLVNQVKEKKLYNSICKIRINREDKGFGFLSFCPNFKNGNNKYSKTLISKIPKNCFESIEKDGKREEKDIELIINNEDPILLMPYEKRVLYSNDIDKITILEIKPSDNLSDDKFLEFDEKINDTNSYNLYEGEKIFILPYRSRKEIVYPRGTIKKIEKKINIQHDCKDIDGDNFYFPIILLENFKVIGINETKNNGIIIYEYLKNFNQELNKVNIERNYNNNDNNNQVENQINNLNDNPNNEIIRNDSENINDDIRIENLENIIILNISISKDDLGKEIFFFDNYKFRNNNEIKRKIGFLTEIETMKDKIILIITNPKDKKKEESFDYKFKPKEEGIYSIEIKFPQKIKDCSYMFYGCTNIVYIDLANFDFQLTTNVQEMFSYCINLTEIKFPKLHYIITNTSYMFNYCKKLVKLDLSNINTENVTSMAGMFQNCEKIKSLDLSKFDTKNNTLLYCMFNDCYELKEIKFSKKFDTEKVMFMNWMFYGCENLENLNLSSFKVDKKNMKDMTEMFIGCDKLEKIKVNSNVKKIFEFYNSDYFKKFEIE